VQACHPEAWRWQTLGSSTAAAAAAAAAACFTAAPDTPSCCSPQAITRLANVTKQRGETLGPGPAVGDIVRRAPVMVKHFAAPAAPNSDDELDL
jgi:hypothetical protein